MSKIPKEFKASAKHILFYYNPVDDGHPPRDKIDPLYEKIVYMYQAFLKGKEVEEVKPIYKKGDGYRCSCGVSLFFDGHGNRFCNYCGAKLDWTDK